MALVFHLLRREEEEEKKRGKEEEKERERKRKKKRKRRSRMRNSWKRTTDRETEQNRTEETNRPLQVWNRLVREK
jgi:hypothetical protein